MRRLVPLLLLLGGCSALGLADGLEQSACDRCDELNDTPEAPDDPCLRWQCSNLDDEMAGVCVIDVRDDDGDGAPSPMCVMDETADCDDTDGANGTGLDEACDLVDNDCDTRIDEGALTLTRADLSSAATLTALSSALGDMEAVALYGAGSDLVAARLPFVGTGGGAITLDGPAMNPQPESTAIARTGTDWAVAYAPGSGCARIVVGTWSGMGGALTMPANHHVNGLPKPSGECAGGDMSPVGHPALASLTDRQLLAAYLFDEAPRVCGGDPTDVALAVSQRDAGGDFGDAGMRASAPVGQSVDGAPALVAVSAGFGYLLAFAEADGTIGVHRVVVNGSTLETTVTADVHVEACARGTCGDVALSVTTVPDGADVALTYRDGGCEEAAAAMRVLEVRGDVVSAPSATLTSEAMQSLRRPVAARRTDPDEWMLAWSFNAGLERRVSMQRYAADGTPVGEVRALLTTTGVFNQPLTIAGGAGREGFRVFAYDSEADMLVRSAAACVEAP